MQFIGVIILLVGLYLVDSGIRNRAPIGFIKAIITDPSDLSGTLNRMNGHWTGAFGPSTIVSGSEGQATSQAQGASNSTVIDHMKAQGYENGKLPASALTVAPGQTFGTQRINKEVSGSWKLLNDAYRERFGSSIQITDGYRSYAGQIAAKAAKGNLAATPGTSNHGWGVAVDLGGGINRFGTPQHEWMKANAGRFGWAQPDWARQGGRKPEPWHWEYAGLGNNAGTEAGRDERSGGGTF